MVFYFEHAGLRVVVRHFNGLGEVLEFIKPRMRCAIRPDQAVADEVQVIRLVAKIPAIGPVLLAVRGLLLETVIDPFPDETAL